MNFLDNLVESNILPDYYLTTDSSVLEKRIKMIKNEMKDDLFIPGHHYQKDEVVQFADEMGDSLELAKQSATKTAKYIVFCGVHFMAETADILSSNDQAVILPDLRAGCSMADMASIKQTEKAWTYLQEIFDDTIMPLTYVNSTADIKAFVGKNGGATVTSSNAKEMIKWAFKQKERLLFLPDQHLGRNTAFELGIKLNEMAVYDPINECLEYDGLYDDVKVILWKGHCSVHQLFTAAQIESIKQNDDQIQVIVHPECPFEVLEKSDLSGSTRYIIDKIDQAPPGSKFAVGTEMNLVNRLIDTYPDKHIQSLNPFMCPCVTMNRIDLPHLAYALDCVYESELLNVISVPNQTKEYAKMALQRMLDH
ncbi:quinolinate synthetase [Pelagirhabdus alkalitolerans]|uniref:Quinolinate synthase n=1 Tax=Pelagirhabdus alkalitolerans TaxID=1612202 RepID=A0A1G6HIK7_9BACI|nr:quinolinate synthase NadA [Pelagirhabdus alkalitolerans]SDB94157.1 quinolinate synthetase [Pelagirhabdus alkalitolerans]